MTIYWDKGCERRIRRTLRRRPATVARTPDRPAPAPCSEEQRAAAATLPRLDGFHDHDGVQVSYVSDYGDMVALGWHDNPDAVLAAFDDLARSEARIDGVYDDPNRAPHADDLHRVWAVNDGTGTGQEQWCLEWVHADEPYNTPGAFPVTLLVM